MGWSRIDDGYMDHPKIMDAGPWAELLDRRAMEHCAKYDTDGLVTKSGLRRISRDIPKVAARVLALVECGRWEVNENGGWWVHDFLKFNPSKAQRESIRESGRLRQKKWRDAVTNDVTNDEVTKGRGGGSVSVQEIENCEQCNEQGLMLDKHGDVFFNAQNEAVRCEHRTASGLKLLPKEATA